MLIHFVCTGNVFRSRLAEAYLESKNLKDVEVISSGINANLNLHGDTSYFATMMAKNHGISDYMKKSWDQTICPDAARADLVVCMTQAHVDWIDYHCDLAGAEIINFGIEDIVHHATDGPLTEQQKIERSEQIYQEITSRIDSLLDERSLL